MSRPVLVTGAAGFVGGHLLDLLAPEGPVVAWHRPGGTPPRLGPSVAWVGVNLLDRDAVHREIQRSRPSTVYHCGGAAHVAQSWQTATASLATNVRGTHHLIDALRRLDREVAVLLPSSAAVYEPASVAVTEDHERRPVSPYGLSKLAQEMVGLHAIADGVGVRVARPFNHIGPRQDPAFSASGFARQIADIERGRSAPEMAVGNLDAKRDIHDVRDTVRAYHAMLHRSAPGAIYNVCSGRAVAIGEVLSMLLERSRAPIRVTTDPAKFRPADVPLVLGDPSRIAHDLGWRSTRPLSETLDNLLDYWRAQP